MTPFDCPRCGVGLVMSERQGIEIDYCPQCRGVWLDRGELDKIIGRTAATQEPSQPAASPLQHPWARGHRHGYEGGGKKRKSGLQEID